MKKYKKSYFTRYQSNDDKYVVGRSYRHISDGVFKVTSIIMPSRKTNTVHIYTDLFGSFMRGSDYDKLTEPYYISGLEPIIDKIEKHSKKHGYSREHDKSHSASEFIMAEKAYIDKNPKIWPWDLASFKIQGDVEDLTNAASMLAKAIVNYNNIDSKD